MSEAWLEVAARLLLSILVGAVIGLNRDLHHKQAGVRTNALVSLGAALAVLVIMPPGEDATHRIDALSRIIQGVLTGIGFLGAGVILRDPSTHHVSGLTTAAAVWFAALLGVASGAGDYALVVIALVLGIGAVVLGGPAERWFRKVDKRESEPPDPGDSGR